MPDLYTTAELRDALLGVSATLLVGTPFNATVLDIYLTTDSNLTKSLNSEDPVQLVINLSAANVTSIANGATAYGWGNHASAGYQLLSSLSNDIATDAASVVKYPTVKAIKDYADNLVIGLVDDRGNYDPTITGAFPVSGGSGQGGAILKGDIWFISVAGTITDGSGTPHLVGIGDSLRALADTPGQTFSNWDFLGTAFGYVPENVANKVTSIGAGSTDTQYPSAKLLYDQLAGKQAAATNLTSLSGLSFASNSFVKMTGTGTFALDTTVYLSSETDPVFSAWLATPPNISTFTNDAGYLTSETDPVFVAWLATNPNISVFTNDSGYLTSESDTLATVTARGASSATPVILSTSLQTPLLIGGSTVDSKILLKATTGAGTLTSAGIQFGVGTDGATVAMTILNNGKVGVGTISPSEILTLGGGNILLKTNNNLYGAIKLWVGSSTGIISAYYIDIERVRLNPNDVSWLNGGNVGIGTNTPTAYLHIKAGTATAGTAPLKLTSGTNLTTPENGAFEFDGTNLYFTVGGVRKTVTLT